jgi:hypothetical protein
MTELPAPLTPPDCDLRGLEWMPLYGDRLFASDTWLMAGPEGRCAAMMLWWASWKQCPAASVPDHDGALAQLAGYGMAVKSWLAVKGQAMRGWIKCADGRLYHPVVAILATEAMGKRQNHVTIEGVRVSRQRRWRERIKGLTARLRELGVTPPRGASLETLERLVVDATASTVPSTQASQVDAKVDGVNACGDVLRDGVEIGKTGQYSTGERKKDSPLPPKGDVETEFHRDFWPVYPRHVGKDAALKAFIKARKSAALSDIMAGLNRYAFKADPEFQPHASTWLNAGNWKIEPDVRPPTVAGPVERTPANPTGRQITPLTGMPG